MKLRRKCPQLPSPPHVGRLNFLWKEFLVAIAPLYIQIKTFPQPKLRLWSTWVRNSELPSTFLGRVSRPRGDTAS